MDSSSWERTTKSKRKGPVTVTLFNVTVVENGPVCIIQKSTRGIKMRMETLGKKCVVGLIKNFTFSLERSRDELLEVMEG